MSKPKSVSVKGMDEFSKKFLFGGVKPNPSEYVSVSGKQTVSAEALQKYEQERTEDFIKRAGAFTEDLVAFIVQQRKSRELSDTETVFGLALANINLRDLYGSPQGSEKKLATKERGKLLEEFDEICYGAQQYFDAHTNND